jgi:chromosome segregation ATPase
MLLKMDRSLKTGLGLLRAGVAYDFDEKDPAQKKVYDQVVKKGMGKRTSKEALKQDAERLSEVQRAELADTSDTNGMVSALRVEADTRAANEARERIETAESAVADARAAVVAEEQKRKNAEERLAQVTSERDSLAAKLEAAGKDAEAAATAADKARTDLETQLAEVTAERDALAVKDDAAGKDAAKRKG